ncbi:MAG: nucleotidyl transferase AbiEii/AbiGii toxin family protein [Candidatus Omnitrophica bacterium]|nr:nucleotidyl transferase AbiEii/AbiGii toxin family protein [Candidatus Omnitrophota bacterium]
MKDYCLALAARQTSYDTKLNTMREYLQANILRALHEQGFFRTTAFVGGTALRFLYNLPRFSEDLDFSLTSPANYKFVPLVTGIKDELARSGYNVEAKYNDRKSVVNAFFKFKDLMLEAGLSPLKSQNFSVKLEIDTKSPAGGVSKTALVNKFFPVTFLTFDLPSLFAGKIHALLTRPYTRGRDYFDLIWYLSHHKGLEPNFTLLKNALTQTGCKAEFPESHNWREVLLRTLGKADWEAIRNDVKNFLENPKDLDALNKENLRALLAR